MDQTIAWQAERVDFPTDRTVALQAEQVDPFDPSHLGAEIGTARLPLGVAALVIMLLSGGLWIGLIWLLDSLV